MQIKVKSVQVVSTGTSDKGPWELIKVTSDDGTGYTTFDKKALKLTAGAVVDIGELVIKEGKLSFKKVVKVISEGTAPAELAPTSNGGGDTPEKRAIIEGMNAVSNVMTAYVALLSRDIIPIESGRLENLWERALVWCDAKIPVNTSPATVTHPPATTKTGEAAPAAASQAPGTIEAYEELDLTPVGNAGDLLNRCKNYGISKQEALDILQLPVITAIEDFNGAWRDILGDKYPQFKERLQFM